MNKPGGKRRVDLVKKFEKQQTNAISIGGESITARVWELFHQTFSTELSPVLGTGSALGSDHHRNCMRRRKVKP